MANGHFFTISTIFLEIWMGLWERQFFGEEQKIGQKIIGDAWRKILVLQHKQAAKT
jgi:hypothetical protein